VKKVLYDICLLLAFCFETKTPRGVFLSVSKGF